MSNPQSGSGFSVDASVPTALQGEGQGPGFFAGLFDWSFSTFVTKRVMQVLYALSVAMIALGALVSVLAGFSQGVASGLISLVVVPFAAVITLILVRVYAEIILVIFRIAETLFEVNQKMD